MILQLFLHIMDALEELVGRRLAIEVLFRHVGAWSLPYVVVRKSIDGFVILDLGNRSFS